MYDRLAIPLIQAIITAALAGLAILAGAILAGVVEPWRPALFVFSLGALLSWLAYRGRANRAAELAGGVDLEPPQQTQTKQQVIKVEIKQEGGRVVDYAFLPATRAQLRELAGGLNTCKPFTVGAWAGAGRPFSRAEFEALRHECITRGLAVWRNPGSPAQGVILTPAGRAAMRYLSTLSPTPAGQEAE